MEQPKLVIDRAKNVAVITVPLNPTGTLTKNGKSTMIATTHGTVRIEDDGKTGVYKVGVNITQ